MLKAGFTSRSPENFQVLHYINIFIINDPVNAQLRTIIMWKPILIYSIEYLHQLTTNGRKYPDPIWL